MSGLGPLEKIFWHWECSQRAPEMESGNVSVLLKIIFYSQILKRKEILKP